MCLNPFSQTRNLTGFRPNSRIDDVTEDPGCGQEISLLASPQAGVGVGIPFGTMSPEPSPQKRFIDHDDAAAVSRMEDTYGDLVRRIDAFLNESGPAVGEDGRVRRGTQLKVREALTVMNHALRQYGYRGPSAPQNPKGVAVDVAFGPGWGS